MKSNKLFLILIPVALLFACGAPATVVPPTQTVPPPTLSATPVPATATPSVPTTAAVTGIPSLAPAGPYFAYLRATVGGVDLVLLDANGPGRKDIALPAQVADQDPENSLQSMQISPDGKWLAFYTGSGGTCSFQPAIPAAPDLSLNLVNLSTGQASLVAHLLPSNYPQNFAKNGGDLIASGVDTGGLANDQLTSTLENAFLCGIRSSAWSPDGRYLAFAGAMDGPSSDTYLYDTQAQKITRLSSGPEEVQWLSWSPDGQWIMQGSTWALGEGMSYNIHASSIDGNTVKTLSNSTTGIVAWLDGHTFLEYDSQNGRGNNNLRAVDVQTGEVRTLWKASFAAYALDAANDEVAISGIPDPYQWTGSLYLIKTANGTQIKIIDGVWRIDPFAVNGQSFFVQEELANGDEGIKCLAADRTLSPATIHFGMLSVAPDGKTWVSVEHNQLLVYSPSGALQRTIVLPVGADVTPDAPTWRPDGSGLLVGFYTGDSFNVSSYTLVTVEIASGAVTLLDQSTTRMTRPVLVQSAP